MNPTKFHLAQLNVAQLLEPLDAPATKEFVDGLDPINALAEKSPGFVWRLKYDNNDATSFNPFDDQQIIVNFSMWEDAQSLKEFVFNAMHLEVLKRKKEWFERFEKPYLVMWHIPIGEIPTLEEAKKRLESLQEHGTSDYAFDFRYLK